MNEQTVAGAPAENPVPEKVMLEAEPEPLEIDLRKAAIVIVDMQNAFVSKGAYIDLKGFDVAPAQAAVEPIQRISSAARDKGCKVIYIFTTHHPLDAGTGPDSVHWHKEASMVLYRKHPEWQDNLLLPGTWGAEIIKELEPQEEDVVIEKPRYSGFFDTNLGTVLKRYDTKYLIITGVASNCCVESTIRDAYYRGYFAIMVSDATAATGPDFMQEASIFNVKTFFGWVTTTENVLKAMA